MFKGHPKGLFVLFFTEMWERFGFYLMLGIFTLYMIDPTSSGGKGFSDFKAADTIVFADNATMLRLLLSMGFIPVHMGYNLRADGADTIRMRKTL